MRRIKNWKNWIAESLEQNPLTNLPEGVTLYTNRMEALDKKEEFFYKKIPNSLKKRDTRENWETSQYDYKKIEKLSQKYNLKLTIDKYSLYIESNVGFFSIIKVWDEYYWLEKLSDFFGETLLSFEIDQIDSLISLLIQILESGDFSEEGVKEILDDSEVEKYRQLSWREQKNYSDDWKGDWTEKEIEEMSSVSNEYRVIFDNHYHFENGTFQIYTMENSFVLTKLSEKEYWIEIDVGVSGYRYFLVKGIDSLKQFLLSLQEKKISH